MHWFWHFLGIDTQASWAYDAWSGFIPGFCAIISASTVVIAAIAIIRRHNCQIHGCWKIGRYAIGGGEHWVCKHHHPEETVREGLTAEHVRLVHHVNRRTP